MNENRNYIKTETLEGWIKDALAGGMTKKGQLERWQEELAIRTTFATKSDQNVFLEAALKYAARGWSVFPCRDDKRPFTKHGFKDSSCDPLIINEWWTRFPNAAIGIDCGGSGLVVVDCDIKPGIDGIDNFTELGIEHDDAFHSSTPSGGLHVIYKNTTNGLIKNSAGKLCPGIDIRASGGYIIAAFSVISSGSYLPLEEDWEGREPMNIPQALIDLLVAPVEHTETPVAPVVEYKSNNHYGDAAMAGELSGVASAIEGTRNDVLNTAAFRLGQLAAGGEIDAAEAEDLLLSATSLPSAEAIKTITSGMDAGMMNPRSRPEPAIQATKHTPVEGLWLNHEEPPFIIDEVPPADDEPTIEGIDCEIDRIFSLKELMSREVAPIQDIVEGFIPGKSVTVFSGDGGTGKSYVLIEMALQVSQGLPWLGMNTHKTPVLIVDLENGIDRAALRAKRLAKGWNLDPNIDYEVSTVFHSNISMHTEETVQGLYDLIENYGFGLIILDSLTDFLEEMDENSNTEMAIVCKRLRQICARTGAAILIIHHVAKSAAGTQWQSARGASAIKDNTDCSIQVSKKSFKSRYTLIMKHDKARDWPYKTVKALMSWQDGMFNTSLLESGDTSESSSGDPVEQAVLDTLTCGLWRNRADATREAMEAASKSRSVVSAKFKSLIEDEMVIEDKGGAYGGSSGVKLA